MISRIAHNSSAPAASVTGELVGLERISRLIVRYRTAGDCRGAPVPLHPTPVAVTAECFHGGHHTKTCVVLGVESSGYFKDHGANLP